MVTVRPPGAMERARSPCSPCPTSARSPTSSTWAASARPGTPSSPAARASTRRCSPRTTGPSARAPSRTSASTTVRRSSGRRTPPVRHHDAARRDRARAAGLPTRRAPVTLSDLPSYTAAFVTNARGVPPVRRIDDGSRRRREADGEGGGGLRGGALGHGLRDAVREAPPEPYSGRPPGHDQAPCRAGVTHSQAPRAPFGFLRGTPGDLLERSRRRVRSGPTAPFLNAFRRRGPPTATYLGRAGFDRRSGTWGCRGPCP